MQRQRVSTGQVVNLTQAYHPHTKAVLEGGEGGIFTIPELPHLCAKIYNERRLTRKRIDKLEVMCGKPPRNSSRESENPSIAWPIDLLCRLDNNQIDGFLMPCVNNAYDLLECFNPSARSRYFPNFTHFSLHRAAYNLVISIEAIHCQGYVIGDVNEKNILIDKTAVVTLVDTDSFQIRDDSGTLYSSPVGKPDYQPPEIHLNQVQNLAPEQDYFGMAVLIFKLLMEGQHPFTIMYLGSDDCPSVGKCIRDNLFPYKLNKPNIYKHGPLVPPFGLLHPKIQDLFIRCFEEGHKKPDARPNTTEWRQILNEVEKDIQNRCPNNNSRHWYHSGLTTCPWCERDQLLQRGSSGSSTVQSRASYIQKTVPQSTNQVSKAKISNFSSSNIFRKALLPIYVGITLLFIVVEPQINSIILTEQATSLEQKEQHEECVNTLSAILDKPMVLSYLRSSTQQKLSQCQAGFSQYKSLLENARKLADEGKFVNAINTASKIGGTSSSSLHKETQELILAWGQRILDLGEERFQKGSLENAFAYARAIPVNTETQVLYQLVEHRIREWQDSWESAEQQFSEAKRASEEGNFQVVIDIGNNLPQIQYWQDKIKPILKKAQVKRIENEVLASNYMILDSSSIPNKIIRDNNSSYSIELHRVWINPKGTKALQYLNSDNHWCWRFLKRDNGPGPPPPTLNSVSVWCDGRNGDGNKFYGRYGSNGEPFYKYEGETIIRCSKPQELDWLKGFDSETVCAFHMRHIMRFPTSELESLLGS